MYELWVVLLICSYHSLVSINIPLNENVKELININCGLFLPERNNFYHLNIEKARPNNNSCGFSRPSTCLPTQNRTFLVVRSYPKGISFIIWTSKKCARPNNNNCEFSRPSRFSDYCIFTTNNHCGASFQQMLLN